MLGKSYCTSCGKPCRVILIDTGIGAYEFWGDKCVDKRIEAVSACCEDIAVDSQGNDITETMVRNSYPVDPDDSYTKPRQLFNRGKS